MEESCVLINIICVGCGRKEKQESTAKTRHYCCNCFKLRFSPLAPKKIKLKKDTQLYKKSHRLVTQAIISGVLIRPLVCSKCNLGQRDPINAHHEDYLNPLDVVWLCDSCHVLWHKRWGSAKNRYLE